jgi:hypothetical protein
MNVWPEASGVPQIFHGQMIRSPVLHFTQYSIYAIHHEMGELEMCNVAYRLTSCRILH